MAFYYCKKQKASILYIHIPKCGGGSVEEYLNNNNFQRSVWNASPRRYCKCSAQHMHAELLQAYLHLDKIDCIFTIVRNPINRMISEYKWRIKLDIAANGINQWYLKARSEYLKDHYYADNHMRPMSEFITNNCNIFKLEEGLMDLPKKLKDIIRVKKKSFSFRHSNIRNQKESLHSDRIRERPELAERYETSQPNHSTIEMIIQDYALDFEMFGYSTNPDHYTLKT